MKRSLLCMFTIYLLYELVWTLLKYICVHVVAITKNFLSFVRNITRGREKCKQISRRKFVAASYAVANSYAATPLELRNKTVGSYRRLQRNRYIYYFFYSISILFYFTITLLLKNNALYQNSSLLIYYIVVVNL